VRAILVSAAVTLIAVLLNYLIPQNALELLMSLVVATLVINWAMISYSHLKFRQHMTRKDQQPLFKALWYPYGNYLCLAFVVLILAHHADDPGHSAYRCMPFPCGWWRCGCSIVIKNKRHADRVSMAQRTSIIK
jgi:aromatic amino acid transport protein AroP